MNHQPLTRNQTTTQAQLIRNILLFHFLDGAFAGVLSAFGVAGLLSLEPEDFDSPEGVAGAVSFFAASLYFSLR